MVLSTSEAGCLCQGSLQVSDHNMAALGGLLAMEVNLHMVSRSLHMVSRSLHMVSRSPVMDNLRMVDNSQDMEHLGMAHLDMRLVL